jgi:hypothetical protein
MWAGDVASRCIYIYIYIYVYDPGGEWMGERRVGGKGQSTKARFETD